MQSLPTCANTSAAFSKSGGSICAARCATRDMHLVAVLLAFSALNRSAAFWKCSMASAVWPSDSNISATSLCSLAAWLRRPASTMRGSASPSSISVAVRVSPALMKQRLASMKHVAVSDSSLAFCCARAGGT